MFIRVVPSNVYVRVYELEFVCVSECVLVCVCMCSLGVCMHMIKLFCTFNQSEMHPRGG